MTKISSSYEVVIRPKQPWLYFDWRGLVQYRDLFWEMVRRDFSARFKQTILGPAWFIINPLITTAIMVIVYSKVLNVPTDGVHPFLFFLSGQLSWGYFSQILGGTGNTLAGNAHIFGKVYFPRLIVPLSVIASNLVSFGIQLLLFSVVYVLLAVTSFGPKGKWAAPFESQLGQEKYRIVVNVDGDKAIVRTTRETADQRNESEIRGAKIVDDQVSFTEKIKVPDREIAVEYRGQLVGDELQLHASGSEAGRSDITAKRLANAKVTSRPTLWVLAMPLVILHSAAVGLGVGLILSAISAKYKDFGHLSSYLMQLWIYVTPVMYPLSKIPPNWQWLALLNPVTAIVEAFRSMLLGTPGLSAGQYSVSVVISAVLCVTGVLLFQRTARTFIDYA
jgi:ABC-type polysaccharide/polyol phosphate export permease